MGSNHSKLCSGVPEREFRRALQDRVQQMYVTPEGGWTSPGTAEAAVHIHCREDEVERYLEEISADPVVFHFKVEKKSPETKPESSVEGGEKPRAAAAAAAVSVGAKGAEPSGDVKVRSEPYGDIVVKTDDQASGLELTLAGLCNQVLHVLQVGEKSSRDLSERTKGHSVVEDLSPSPLESEPSILSSGSQAGRPPLGPVESLNTGDVRHPNEDTALADVQKAPCGPDLELATGVLLGAAEEPTASQAQLEEASSKGTLEEADEGSSEDTLEETSDASSGGTLGEVGEAPPDAGQEETADGCSDVKTDLETKEPSETWLSFGKGLPRAASEPLSSLKEREGKVLEDYCNGGKADPQLEVLPKRAQRETPAAADSGGDAVDLDSFQKDGAIPTPEPMKEKERQTSAVQNMEAQSPPNVTEMTGAASSPKAPSETAKPRQSGPLFSLAEPIAQVSGTGNNNPSAQLTPVSISVSDPALEDLSPGQRC